MVQEISGCHDGYYHSRSISGRGCLPHSTVKPHCGGWLSLGTCRFSTRLHSCNVHPGTQAIRILGFTSLGLLTPGIFLIKSRLPKRDFDGFSSVLDFGGLRDLKYLLLVIGTFVTSLGCKFAEDFIPLGSI